MIKLVGIHKIYEDGNTGFLALKDINLDFKDDHFVCILGKSGSGKTTLLNIIGGLDTPSSGHMVINGELTTKFTQTQWDYFRNYKIGFVFQNYSLIEHLSVLDNVKLAIKLQGIKESEAKERALAMLDKVRILDQAYKLPKKLSGGQRQRVAIARALVNNPDVILADEPTGNLDKKTSKEVLEILKEISAEKLIIMVTHSKKIANTYADRIIELKDGMVESDTKPQLNEKVRIYKPNIKYTKFRFFDKIKHAVKNIRMKKWRSFLIALGLAIGVASFVLIDGISNGIKINVKRYLTGQGNTEDLILMVYDDSEIEDIITTIEGIDEVLGVRLNAASLPVEKINDVELEDVYFSLSYDFIKEPAVKSNLLGKVHGDGHWPSKEDEIIVSYDFASSLYSLTNIEAIWEKVKHARLTVVVGFYYEVPFGFILGNCPMYPFVDEDTAPGGYDSATLGAYATQIEKQKELYGKLIIDGYDNIYFCEDYDTFPKFLSNRAMTEEFTVVGVIDSRLIGDSYVLKDSFMRIYKHQQIYTESYYIYLTEKGREEKFKVKEKIADELYLRDIFIYDAGNYDVGMDALVDIFTGMAQFVISMILIISVITAGLMLLMILLISVMERSREIGILRSLGATRSDILSVFITESGVIGFLAGIIGIILSLLVTLAGNMYIRYRYEDFLNNTFNRSDINLVILKPLSCVLAVIICIFLAMVFGLIPAIRASKKTPINALKRI